MEEEKEDKLRSEKTLTLNRIILRFLNHFEVLLQLSMLIE